MMSMKELKAIFTVVVKVCVLLLLFAPLPVSAGSLDPPASAVDGSGNPVPTMRTVNELTPTWSQTLRSDDGDSEGCNSSRFKCVLNNEAVLDLETGLVWQRNLIFGLNSLGSGMYLCNVQILSNKGGWRLPSLAELKSLLANGIPLGSPFSYDSDISLWTATIEYGIPSQAYIVNTRDGRMGAANVTDGRYRFTCVRGYQ